MILACVILGVALLVVATFVSPPGRNALNIGGAILLVAGVVLVLYLAGSSPVAW